MATEISYQEAARAIAAILTLHPQFDKLFTAFESRPWVYNKQIMMKQMPEGGSMILERHKITGKLKIRFSVDVNLKDY